MSHQNLRWYGDTKAFYLSGLLMILPNYFVSSYFFGGLGYTGRFLVGAALFFGSSYALTVLLAAWARRQPAGSFWRKLLD